MTVRAIAALLRISRFMIIVVMVMMVVARVIVTIEKPLENIVIMITNCIVLMLDFNRKRRTDAVCDHH